MCYSIQIERSLKKLAEAFNARVDEDAFWEFVDLNQKYPKIYRKPAEDNKVYPDYYAPVIISQSGSRVITPMRYQLLPHFSKTESYRAKNQKTGRLKKVSTYNARLDALEKRKAWATPFLKSHCIIPFKGFFEWVSHNSQKREISFHPTSSNLMWAAGLFDTWSDPTKEIAINSFAIITTEPVPEVLEMGHDRCPLFLNESLIDSWLNPSELSTAGAYDILSQQQRDIYRYQWVDSNN